MAGIRPRLHANLEALRTLRRLQSEGRAATAEEQRVLARWSGWGAIAQQAFHHDYAAEFAAEQAELRSLLTKDEYAAAKRSTLNAHYTDASLVQAIWQALGDLGVRGGNVLEPGCGSGNFVGFAPPQVHMTGVELDSTTAAIASLLYPDAQIRNESFVETLAPRRIFDAVVGNVPFGEHKLYDTEYNPDRSLSIHNHFLIKSLDLTKPGGVVAVITSHHTMDNQSDQVRAQITRQADVLGVVRLPSSAHEKAAGTKVVTDILVLRKRSAGEAESHLASITDGVRDVAAEDADVDVPVHVNTYFDAHPEHVLGQVGWRSGQFGPELEVTGPAQGLGERVRAALGGIVSRAEEAGLAAVPAPADTQPLRLAEAGRARFEGLIQVDDEGRLTRLRRGLAEPYAPAQHRDELIALVRLRDTIVELMDSEAATRVETPHIAQLRRRLNTQYDAYVAKYGYINRRNVDKNGVASRPSQGKFRLDPLSAYVYGLEKYDPSTRTGIKTEVFISRVLNPPSSVKRADNPRDALYTALRETGTVDLDRVASLLGLGSPQEARAALGELVFDDPAQDGLVSAPAYLSGDVRRKLREARQAAESNPDLRVNVRALEQVQPPELTAAEILPQLGAAWIPDEVVQQFAREVLENDEIQVAYTGEGKWWVSDHGKDSHQATTVYGTKEYSANKLLETALNMKAVEVRSKNDEGRFFVDTAKSANAEAKMQAMRERFNTWLWQDPKRTAELVELYNDQFNALRLRNYDDEVRPDRVFPGLVEGFVPRPHQIAAVERVLAEDAVLLAHSTGAGKTSEMIMAAMEARRLGQVNKPAITVPNNVIEQFAAEFRQRYPHARILVADKQKMGKEYRQEFLGQVAMGDWDAVIFTHEQFEKIPMNYETRKRRLTEEHTRLAERFERLQEEGVVSKATIKQAERAAITAEERLRKHLENDKDQGITFEHTGIDMVQVDEAHKYKNLSVVSNIVDAAKVSSNRADDMLMKFDYVRERGGKLVMATATPLANSMSEMWVFTRFLNPAWLAERDMMDFDRWAATFGLLQSVPETDEANQLVMRTRFAKFRNVPELQLSWSLFCDTKTKKQLKLPEPEVAWYDEKGVRHMGARSILLPPTPAQLDYQIQIIEPRMEAFRDGAPWVMGTKFDEVTGETYEVKDHTLWIGNHAQANSLDRRLAPDPPQITPLAQEELRRSLEELARFNALESEEREARMVEYRELLQARAAGEVSEADLPDWFNAMALGMTKTDVAADLLFKVWDQNKDRTFLDRHTGQPHPRTGALQLVFCDSGVWNKAKARDGAQYTVYEDLRERLVALGIPREQIRFFQEAGDDDRKKAELFEACRDGRVSVLIGNTQGMGEGTNVQERAVHLLHMDCPWRPCDIEQREGRIERQGNQSDEILITRLATANSFDAKKWSTNARKAGFIGQIMRGEVTEREIEDIDPHQADYAGTAALATNSPRQQAYAEARQKLSVLTMEYQNWRSSQATSRQVLQWIPHRISEADTFIAELDAVLERRVPTRGDAFRMQVGHHVLDKRKDAGAALKAVIASLMDAHPGDDTITVRPVGRLGGLEVTASIGFNPDGRQKWGVLSFEDLPYSNPLNGVLANRVAVGGQDDLLGANPVSLCQSLERVLDRAEVLRADFVTYRQRQVDSQRQAEAHLQMSFGHHDRLEELTQEVARLEEELGISHSSAEVNEVGEPAPEASVAASSTPGVGPAGPSRGKITPLDPSEAQRAGGEGRSGGASGVVSPGRSSGGGAPAGRGRSGSAGGGRSEEQIVQAAREAINKLQETTSAKKRADLRNSVLAHLKEASQTTTRPILSSLLASAHMSDTSGPWDDLEKLAKLGVRLPSEEAAQDPGGETVKSALEDARAKLQSLQKSSRSSRPDKSRMTSLRIRLSLLAEAVERGEEDRDAALELFAEVNAANLGSAYSREVWRQRIAVPTADSSHFDRALTVLHNRDQTTVRVPAHLVEEVADLLTGHRFKPDQSRLLWHLPEAMMSARERELNQLLIELDTRPGIERMRQDYAEELQEQAAIGTAPQPWDKQDEELRERVNTLVADSDLRQAWEQVSERIAQIRAQDPSVSDAEITELPAGQLRSQVLVQARRRERSLDEERTRQGELTPDQREAFELRYRRQCPHLDQKQIRDRVDASPELTTVLGEAYGTLDNLASVSEVLPRKGQRLRLEAVLKTLAQVGGTEQALTVMAAANTVDPAGAVDREILRTRLALESAAAENAPPLLAFSTDGDRPQMYVSVHTPAHVRHLLHEHGWSGLGGPLEPVLYLDTDTELDREGWQEERLASTLLALDALPAPVSRVEASTWAQMRESVDTYLELIAQEKDLLAQADELAQQQQVRRAVHLVLEHLEQRRATARVEVLYNTTLLDKHIVLMKAGYGHEQVLNDKLALLPAQDTEARTFLAGNYWEQCPHLTLEQIAERTGVEAEHLSLAGVHRHLYVLEQGGGIAHTSAPAGDAFTPVREAIAQLSAEQDKGSRGLTVNLSPARTAFTNAITAVADGPDVERQVMAEMFVLANRADPAGAWTREDLRSTVLYPEERFEEGAPVLEVRGASPTTVRLLVEAEEVPTPVWTVLEELKFRNRKGDPSSWFTLPPNLRWDTTAERLNTLVVACDEAGVELITHTHNDKRERARELAEWRERKGRLAVIETRTPQVRAAAQDLREHGRLRDAVETIEEHWIALELLDQRQWQGHSDARKHELWDLHQELMEQGRQRHQELHQVYQSADRAGQVEVLRRLLVECPHVQRSKLEAAIARAEEQLAGTGSDAVPANPREAAPVRLDRELHTQVAVSLELDSPQAEQDRELLQELARSWTGWRTGTIPSGEHEQTRQRVREAIQERLEAAQWGPAWRLLDNARCVDSQSVAAYTLVHADNSETLGEMAWHVLGDTPVDPAKAQAIWETADKALSEPGTPQTKRGTPFHQAFDQLTQAGMWRTAEQMLTLGEAAGADCTTMREELRQTMLRTLRQRPAGNHLLVDSWPEPAVWERAFQRLGTSMVHDRETQDRNYDATSSDRGAMFTSALISLWSNNHEAAALALMDHANHRDPARAWHHEDLRSRVLFTTVPTADDLVRIDHTKEGTRILALQEKSGIAWDSPAGQALREAKFSKGRSANAKHLWYLNSNTSLEVRTVRVGQLISLLDQAGIPHISESRFQALSQDASAAVAQDVRLKERVIRTHLEVERLAGLGEHKAALEMIDTHQESMRTQWEAINSREAFGLAQAREELTEEARALAGKARLRYQKAKREGARPSELLQLLQEFVDQHPQGEEVLDVRLLRTSLEQGVREGDWPLVATSPEPAPTPTVDSGIGPSTPQGEFGPAPAPAGAATALLAPDTTAQKSTDRTPQELREHTLQLLEALERPGPDRVRARDALLQHLTELERLRGTSSALRVVREANRIDPEGRLEREHHRSAMALAEWELEELPRVLVFDTAQMQDTGLVHLSLPTDTPVEVRSTLLELGWGGAGAHFEPTMTLNQDDLDREVRLEDRLVQTWRALQELTPEPEFALAQAWEAAADPLRRRGAAELQGEDLGAVEERVAAHIQQLRAQGHLDQARDALIGHLDLLRENGQLGERRWQPVFLDLVEDSYDALDELVDHAARIDPADLQARRETAEEFLPRVVHLTQTQVHCTLLQVAMDTALPPKDSTASERARQALTLLETATVERAWLRSRLLELLPQTGKEITAGEFDALVVAANRADPQGRWEREKVRSAVLYPVDRTWGEWPFNPTHIVDPYGVHPVRTEYPGGPVSTVLAEAGLIAEEGPTWTRYRFDGSRTPREALEAVQELLGRCDELGVHPITAEQHSAWKEYQYTTPAQQRRTDKSERLVQRAQAAAEALADGTIPAARAAALELAEQVRVSAASDRAPALLDLANHHDPDGAWEREQERSQWTLPTNAALGFTAAVVVDHTEERTHVWVPPTVKPDVRRRLEELYFVSVDAPDRSGPQTQGRWLLPARLDHAERTALVGQFLAYLGEVDQPRMSYAHWRRRHDPSQALPNSSVRSQERDVVADARNHPSYRKADLAAYRYAADPTEHAGAWFTDTVQTLLKDTSPVTALELIGRVEHSGLELPKRVVRLRDELSTPLQVDLHLVATSGIYPGQIDLLRDVDASQVRLSRQTMEQLDQDLAAHVLDWPEGGPYPRFVLSENEQTAGYFLHRLGDRSESGVRLDPDEQDMFSVDRSWGGVALREPHPAGHRLDGPDLFFEQDLHRLLAKSQIARLDVPPVEVEDLPAAPEGPKSRANWWITTSNKVTELVGQGALGQAVRVLTHMEEACRTQGENDLWTRHHRALAYAMSHPQQSTFANQARATLNAHYLCAWYAAQPHQQSARMRERADEHLLRAVMAAPHDEKLFWQGRKLSERTAAWDDWHEKVRLKRPLPEDVAERMRERSITLPVGVEMRAGAFPINDEDLVLPGEQVPLDTATIRVRRALAHQVALHAWKDLDGLDRVLEEFSHRSRPFASSVVRGGESASPVAPWAGRPSVDDRVFVYTWARRTRADLAPPTVEQALAEAQALSMDHGAAAYWLQNYSDLVFSSEYAEAKLGEPTREDKLALNSALAQHLSMSSAGTSNAQLGFDHYWAEGDFTKAAHEMDLGGRELFLTEHERAGVVAQRYWAEHQATLPTVLEHFNAGELHRAATVIDGFHHRWQALDLLHPQVKHYEAQVENPQALSSLRYEIHAEVAERSGQQLRTQIEEAYVNGDTARAAQLYLDYERLAGPDSLVDHHPFTPQIVQELRQAAATTEPAGKPAPSVPEPVTAPPSPTPGQTPPAPSALLVREPAELPAQVHSAHAQAAQALTELSTQGRSQDRERARQDMSVHLDTLLSHGRFTEAAELIRRADHPSVDPDHAVERLTLYSRALAGLEPDLLHRAVHLDHDPQGRTRVYNVPNSQVLHDVLRSHKFSPAKDPASGEVWQLQERWKEPTRHKWAQAALSELRLNGHPVISREAYLLLTVDLSAWQRAEIALARLEATGGDAARQELSQALQECVASDPAQASAVEELCERADRVDPDGWPSRMHAQGLARFTGRTETLAGVVRIDYDAAGRTSTVHLPAEGDLRATTQLLRSKPFSYTYDEERGAWTATRPRVKVHTYRDRMRDLLEELEAAGHTWIAQSAYTELASASAPAATPPAPQTVALPTEGPAPATEEPERVPVPEIAPVPLTFTSAGHVGAPFDVLRLPTAKVARLREFPPKEPGGDSTWMVVYGLGNGRELVHYSTTDPQLAEGQQVQDLWVKVTAHTWWTPKRGRNAGKPRPRTTVDVVTPPTGTRYAPTQEQRAIIDAARQRKKMVVQAGAGTGKTTTLTQVAEELAAQGRKGTLVVFGRANAADARRKLAHVPVQVATMHALAHQAVARPFSQRLKNQTTPDWETTARRMGLSTLVLPSKTVLEAPGLARLINRAVETFELSADTRIGVQHINRPPGMDSQDFGVLQRALEPHLSRAWEDMCDPHGNLFKFRHDTYVKIWHLSGPRISVGDYLMVDEAQDMTPVFRAILQLQTHMQQMWVGDPNQSIYAYRGAINALEGQNPDVTLTLTQSFRYGQAVADEANKWLELLGADFRLRGNPAMDSVVHDGDLGQADAVLVRTNAGAFSAAVAELDAGRRVAIQGGTEELASLIRAARTLHAGQRTSHPELMRFDTWSQVVREANDHPEDLGQLATFVKLVESYDREDGIDHMLQLLEQMDDADPQVVVSTAHKAKGLEWPRVRIGLDFTPPQQPEGLPQEAVGDDHAGEQRLSYVAITRGRQEVARGSLSYIDDLVLGTTKHMSSTPLTDQEVNTDVQADPTPQDETLDTSSGMEVASATADAHTPVPAPDDTTVDTDPTSAPLADGETQALGMVIATGRSYPVRVRIDQDGHAQVRTSPATLSQLAEDLRAADEDPFGNPQMPDWPRFGYTDNPELNNLAGVSGVQSPFVPFTLDADGLVPLPFAFDALTTSTGINTHPLPPVDETAYTRALEHVGPKLVRSAGGEPAPTDASYQQAADHALQAYLDSDTTTGPERLEQIEILSGAATDLLGTGALQDSLNILERAHQGAVNTGEQAVWERQIWAARTACITTADLIPEDVHHRQATAVLRAAHAIALTRIQETHPGFHTDPTDRQRSYAERKPVGLGTAIWLFPPHGEIANVEAMGLRYEATRLYQLAHEQATSEAERDHWEAQTKFPFAPPGQRALIYQAVWKTQGWQQHPEDEALTAQFLRTRDHVVQAVHAAIRDHNGTPDGGPPAAEQARAAATEALQLHAVLRYIDPGAAQGLEQDLQPLRTAHQGLDLSPPWFDPGPGVAGDASAFVQARQAEIEHSVAQLRERGETELAREAIDVYNQHRLRTGLEPMLQDLRREAQDSAPADTTPEQRRTDALQQTRSRVEQMADHAREHGTFRRAIRALHEVKQDWSEQDQHRDVPWPFDEVVAALEAEGQAKAEELNQTLKAHVAGQEPDRVAAMEVFEQLAQAIPESVRSDQQVEQMRSGVEDLLAPDRSVETAAVAGSPTPDHQARGEDATAAVVADDDLSSDPGQEAAASTHPMDEEHQIAEEAALEARDEELLAEAARLGLDTPEPVDLGPWARARVHLLMTGKDYPALVDTTSSAPHTVRLSDHTLAELSADLKAADALFDADRADFARDPDLGPISQPDLVPLRVERLQRTDHPPAWAIREAPGSWNGQMLLTADSEGLYTWTRAWDAITPDTDQGQTLALPEADTTLSPAHRRVLDAINDPEPHPDEAPFEVEPQEHYFHDPDQSLYQRLNTVDEVSQWVHDLVSLGRLHRADGLLIELVDHAHKTEAAADLGVWNRHRQALRTALDGVGEHHLSSQPVEALRARVSAEYHLQWYRLHVPGSSGVERTRHARPLQTALQRLHDHDPQAASELLRQAQAAAPNAAWFQVHEQLVERTERTDPFLTRALAVRGMNYEDLLKTSASNRPGFPFWFVLSLDGEPALSQQNQALRLDMAFTMMTQGWRDLNPASRATNNAHAALTEASQDGRNLLGLRLSPDDVLWAHRWLRTAPSTLQPPTVDDILLKVRELDDHLDAHVPGRPHAISSLLERYAQACTNLPPSMAQEDRAPAEDPRFERVREHWRAQATADLEQRWAQAAKSQAGGDYSRMAKALDLQGGEVFLSTTDRQRLETGRYWAEHELACHKATTMAQSGKHEQALELLREFTDRWPAAWGERATPPWQTQPLQQIERDILTAYQSAQQIPDSAQPRTVQVNEQDRAAADAAFDRAGRARKAYQYQEALQELDQAHALDPEREDLWRWARTVLRADQASNRAGHLFKQGKHQAALASLNEAARLDPSRVELWEKRRGLVQQARTGKRPDNSAQIVRQKATAPVRPRRPDSASQRGGAASTSPRKQAPRQGGRQQP